MRDRNRCHHRRPWLIFLVLACGCASADGFRVETVANGLDYPWSIAFLPDGDLLVTELGGQLRRVSDGIAGSPLAGVPPVYRKGQGGLFDIVLDPDFARSGQIFLSYAEGPPDSNALAVLRARLTPDSLADVQVIYRAAPRKSTPVHYGGRMAFLPDQTLLVTVGDGFDYREAAQDQHSDLGKTLRMTTDGRPPPNPPFPDRPHVFSYGHRNAQGLLVAADGTLYLHEHGPRGGDEINILAPGQNYGWPAVSHGVDYSGARISPFTHWQGMVAPLLVWTPSIAPSGFALYTGDLFPHWQGDLFVGALAARELRRVDLENGQVAGQESLLGDLGARIRDVRNGPDGALYVVTDGAEGRILKLVPAQ